MTAVQLAPSAVALLLLAAHFYRAGNHVAMAVSVLAIGLLCVRRPWAARAIQLGLVLGTLEWLHSTIVLVQARSAAGEPFLRLALILGAVSLFTLLAALLLQARSARAYFVRFRTDAASPRT